MSIATEVFHLAQWALNKGVSQSKILCPECSASRSTKANRAERCMSLGVDEDRAVYKCHHCGIDGIVPMRKRREKIIPKPIIVNQTYLSPAALNFLRSRGITEAVAREHGLFSEFRKFRKANESECVGFPYIDENGKLEAVKYRAFPVKDFIQQGSAATLWGFEKGLSSDHGTVIIVEGEIDKLTAEVVPMGYLVLGVPNGAPMAVSNGKIDPTEDKKFRYVWRAKKILDKAERIIIAVDGDDAGKFLGEELARRVGKAKCWRVRDYPDGTKDLNDVLMKYGVSGVTSFLKNIEPWPMIGLNQPSYYSKQVEDFYNNGLGKGHTTGYWTVDALFTLWPGIYVVTGIPGSGKSEMIDQITFNTAMKSDWKWALCSFENPPPLHIAKISEKKVQKPFHMGPTERMSMTELRDAREWIDDHYTFIDLNDGQPPTIDVILDRAMAAVSRLGVRGIVIDPYNHIQRPNNENEVNFVNDMLQKIRAFQKATDTITFIVAHPHKLMAVDGRRPVPTGYDISGAAHWFNHADAGITVHRPNADTNEAEIYCWKARFKWIGRIGKTTLDYSPATGTYTERGLDDITKIEAPKAPPFKTPATAPWEE